MVGGASPVCHQLDHLVAYNCGDFRAIIQASGWG